MTARRVMPRCTALFLLLAVAGGGWCQTQLLDPEPRTCRTQDNAGAGSALSHGRRNEYPAGGVLMVLAEVPGGVFGSLEIDLCPEGDAEVECLDRVPLRLADGSGTSYNLHNVPRTDNYEIPVILPDDITCPTCTLQLRVSTRSCADEDACPITEDTFCSDITVKDIKSPVRRGGGYKAEFEYACKEFYCRWYVDTTNAADTTDSKPQAQPCCGNNQTFLDYVLCTLFDSLRNVITRENMKIMCKKASTIKENLKKKLPKKKWKTCGQ